MADHENDHQPAHEHGTMDISTQEKTFAGFMKFWVWLFGGAIGILIFLALFNS